MPTYYLHAILDDLVTERYSAILYQCFDGNISWLDRMIHGDMDPYARLALLDVIIHYYREAIEIDKYVYLALHRRVPYDEVDCDEKEFKRRQMIYLKKAKELLEVKMEKDGIESYREYDEKNMIHYNCEEWVV